MQKYLPGIQEAEYYFTVAVAHAVTMFAAPGPMEEAHAMIFCRLLCFAKDGSNVTHTLLISSLKNLTSCPGFVSSASPSPTAIPCPKIVKILLRILSPLRPWKHTDYPENFTIA